MSRKLQPNTDEHSRHRGVFGSELVDKARREGNRLKLHNGVLIITEVFGFGRGVERELEIFDQAVDAHRSKGTQLFLLGEIIHNPWVNNFFRESGVRILTPQQRREPERYITLDDCAVIPAFGVPLEVQKRLEKIGCEIVDTTCGDVRRLWIWAHQAAADGFGVLIFGRARHDETVVTKSRLANAGGKYVIAGDIEEVDLFGKLITGEFPAEKFRTFFGPEATNSDKLSDFDLLAQVSQTTMLYDETQKVREILRQAYQERYTREKVDQYISFQPTVCRATQARQSSALELARAECDLIIVVGGFGSSNTRHLFELARDFAPAFFIETADDILSIDELTTYDIDADRPKKVHRWFPEERPLRIGVLAGASSPEIVLGEVLKKLSKFLEVVS